MQTVVRRALLLLVYPTLAVSLALPALGVVRINGSLSAALALGLIFSCLLFFSLTSLDILNDTIDALDEQRHSRVKGVLGWAMAAGFFLVPGLLLLSMSWLFSGLLVLGSFLWVLLSGAGLMLGGLVLRLLLLP
jgi:hypothetical protein